MEINLHGYTYTVVVVNGKITQIACKGRWPLVDARFIGDDGWLLSELQKVVDAC